MSILPEVAAVIAALPLPQGFSVCELGDQGMSGLPTKRLAKDWYEQDLGCGRYVSIDGNGRGSFTADLNMPILPELGVFDLATDCGTGEHVFDQAQVWSTLHRLAKPGGYIVVDRPSQGYAKHCFYLANDCLYRDVAAANHYEVVRVEERQTPRGSLLLGVFRRPDTRSLFEVPQQGRYRDSLVIA